MISSPASHSRFLTLRGWRCHLRCWGAADSPALVLLHGFGDVSASWQFVVAALARDWQVLAPDWRGFGLSGGLGREAAGTFWFADYLADLDALLEVLSPQQPVNLVGHSLGGNVACLYAGIRPERVARLVNLEGLGLRPHEADQVPGRFGKWLAEQRVPPAGFREYPDRAAFAARLQKENPRLSDARAAFLAQHLGEVHVDARGQEVIRLAADAAHRGLHPVPYRLEEAMACWRAVRAPVLWVAGRDSWLSRELMAFDSADYQQRLDCFADLRHVMVEDCGHNLHHDQPGEVARLIEEFIV